MHLRFLTLFIFIAATGFAQGIKTDTVQQGFYLPLDSAMLSCKIGITPQGKQQYVFKHTGNRIPDSTISSIGHLAPGSVVVYSEVTVLRGGIAQKAPSVRYIIGSRNTHAAKRDPSYPDTLTAKAIGAIVLDQRVSSFSVSWVLDGNFYSYDITGNGIFGEARTAIEALPSGTTVHIEKISRKERDGSFRMMPNEIHVVK